MTFAQELRKFSEEYPRKEYVKTVLVEKIKELLIVAAKNGLYLQEINLHSILPDSDCIDLGIVNYVEERLREEGLIVYRSPRKQGCMEISW